MFIKLFKNYRQLFEEKYINPNVLHKILPLVNITCNKKILIDNNVYDKKVFTTNIARVNKLKEFITLSKLNHYTQIINLPTLKEAHIYCMINKIAAQQYGPLLEKCIREKFNYIKNNAKNCAGDCTKDEKNIEIKVSLGGTMRTKFNFVQIRPSHNCDIYIFTAYYLSIENINLEGELYIFKIPHNEIIKLIICYGGYAHGTIKEYGIITEKSFNNNNEYVLRTTINDKCWKALMQFRIREYML